MFVSEHNKYYCKCTCDSEEICLAISEKVQSQYFSGCESISMEGFDIDNFKKFKPSNISREQLYSCLSYETD